MTTLRAAPNQTRLQVLGEKQGPQTGESRYLISPKRTITNPKRRRHKNKEMRTHRWQRLRSLLPAWSTSSRGKAQAVHECDPNCLDWNGGSPREKGGWKNACHCRGTGCEIQGGKTYWACVNFFCPDPLAGFEKMAGFQIFYCLKIKCFHS